MYRILLAIAMITLLPGIAHASLTAIGLQRWGRVETFQVNTSYVSLEGNPSRSEVGELAMRHGLAVMDEYGVRGVTVLELSGTPSLARIEAFLRDLARIPSVRWTAPVFFDGPNVTLLTGTMWIRFPKGTGASEIERKLASVGLGVVRILHGAHEIALVRISGYALDMHAKLVSQGFEAFPGMMRRLYPKMIPEDEYFQYEWYLRNTGDNVYNVYTGLPMEGIPLADVRATDAWDITTGSPDTVIAVIDSGVDCDHPELQGKCIAEYNAITGASDAAPPPPASDLAGGHGTSVAGVAAAPMDGQGVVGVCPQCSIVAIRLIDSGTFLTDEMIFNAYKFAVDNGATVINNSWGPAGNGTYFIPASTGELEGMDYALAGRDGRGVVVVYAAGNEDIDIKWYGHLNTGKPNVIAVAASNHRDHRSTYSNYGESISVAAPSSDQYMNPMVYTLERVGGGEDGNGYTKFFGGTSSAAPVVSGVIGLVASYDSDLDATQLIEIIEETADKVDPDGGFYDEEGHSPAYGYGRVNAHRALLRAAGQEDRPWCSSPAAQEDCDQHLDEDCNGFVDDGCTDASPLGKPCSSASECGSESYWECPDTGKVRNLCTWDCTERPCPNGFECVEGVCSPECTSEGGCPSDEFVCSDYTFGQCLPKCHSDEDCPEGEKCDTSTNVCRLDTDGLPGSPCTSDECVGPGAMCLTEGMGFPGGYCIHSCSTDADCGTDAKCLRTGYGSYCYRACSFDGDCRPEYVCEQAGPRAGTCYKKCTKDDQCTGWNEDLVGVVGCDLTTGRCVWLDATDTGDTTDTTDTGDTTDTTDTGDSSDTTDTGDSTEVKGGSSGCSCTVVGATAPVPWNVLVLLGVLLALVRRNRR